VALADSQMATLRRYFDEWYLPLSQWPADDALLVGNSEAVIFYDGARLLFIGAKQQDLLARIERLLEIKLECAEV